MLFITKSSPQAAFNGNCDKQSNKLKAGIFQNRLISRLYLLLSSYFYCCYNYVEAVGRAISGHDVRKLGDGDFIFVNAPLFLKKEKRHVFVFLLYRRVL